MTTRGPLADDPLAGPPDPPAPAAEGMCKARGKCDGTGWVHVQPSYAEKRWPMPDDLALGASEADEVVHAQQVRQAELGRATTANTVYPCKDCRPTAFFRWAGGHYGPNHVAASCDQCVEALGLRRRATR